MVKTEYDVVIIGAGISGLTSAMYLKRAGLTTLVIENKVPGGMLNKGYDIENYPGFLKINSLELLANIYSQITNLEIEILENDIEDISLENKIIKLNNKEIKAKYIIIATGRREKRLNLENEDKLIGNGISFCATCDGTIYKNKEVIIVGGANSALTEALYLSNVCSKVTIIYRNDKLKGEKILIDRILKKDNINIIYNANIKEYNIINNKISSVTLDNESIIPCEGIFLEIGYIPNSEKFNLLKENNYIIVNNKYETNIEKVYAIGDVIKKDFYQLTTAVSDATVASLNIIKDYNKNKDT